MKSKDRKMRDGKTAMGHWLEETELTDKIYKRIGMKYRTIGVPK